MNAIWLRREGGENDPKASVVVLIEIAGAGWVEIIREHAAGNFSHIIEPSGIVDAYEKKGKPYTT